MVEQQALESTFPSSSWFSLSFLNAVGIILGSVKKMHHWIKLPVYSFLLEII